MLFHKNPHEISCIIGCIIVVSWLYHSCIMVVSWQYQGRGAGTPANRAPPAGDGDLAPRLREVSFKPTPALTYAYSSSIPIEATTRKKDTLSHRA